MDYSSIGLKAGIEIHVQLNTKHKLFCRCLSRLTESEASLLLKRRMRDVAGELGEKDIAAMQEVGKTKEFEYRLYPQESCLVEGDEEIIRGVSREALEKGLRIALMLSCTIPGEIHVMRKIILNGSVVSGFQRTMCIGLGGCVETAEGRITIPAVFLEEDSAQIVERGKGKDIYGLDRLSIPLVEIGTAPEIRSPEQAKEVAAAIGMVLKSSGGIKTGLGTIRQDVNVSVEGGARNEIKGVQNLSMIPKLIESEAERQLKIIAKGERPGKEVRQAMPDCSTKFLRSLPGPARMYPETDTLPIAIDTAMAERIRRTLPELSERKLERLKGYGLSADIAEKLVRERKAEQFERLAKICDPKAAANILVVYISSLSSEGVDTSSLTEERLSEVFTFLKNASLPKEALIQLLKNAAQNPKEPIQKLAKLETVSEDDVRRVVKKVISGNKAVLGKHNPEQVFMGLVMKELRGKAAGSVVMRILAEEIKRAKL